MALAEPTIPTARKYLEELRGEPDATKYAGMTKLRDLFRSAGYNPDSDADAMYNEINMAKPFFDLVLAGIAARIK
jgi:hypothetical protein